MSGGVSSEHEVCVEVVGVALPAAGMVGGEAELVEVLERSDDGVGAAEQLEAGQLGGDGVLEDREGVAWLLVQVLADPGEQRAGRVAHPVPGEASRADPGLARLRRAGPRSSGGGSEQQPTAPDAEEDGGHRGGHRWLDPLRPAHQHPPRAQPRGAGGPARAHADAHQGARPDRQPAGTHPRGPGHPHRQPSQPAAQPAHPADHLPILRRHRQPALTRQAHHHPCRRRINPLSHQTHHTCAGTAGQAPSHPRPLSGHQPHQHQEPQTNRHHRTQPRPNGQPSARPGPPDLQLRTSLHMLNRPTLGDHQGSTQPTSSIQQQLLRTRSRPCSWANQIQKPAGPADGIQQ